MVIPAVVMSVPQGSIPALAKDPGVRYISPDGPVQVIPGVPSGLLKGLLQLLAPAQKSASSVSTGSVNWTKLLTTYPFDTGAQSAWAGTGSPVSTGTGVAVALLDSGVDATQPDLAGHLLTVNVNQAAQLGTTDGYGHGTHVAGIIGGQDPAGQYIGIAPKATIVSVKVSDDLGGAYESDVLRGLDWVELHQATYNLRAINLSVSTSVPQSYATSAIDAAVEHLWSQGVTVVASAGNLGSAQDAVWYAPGNDPLVITVGCLDENQTVSPTDDSLCPISSAGITEDGFAKPNLVAPGRKIVSGLSAGVNGQPSVLATTFPDRITADGHHIRLSGTSMATPMVTGAIALLLQNYPNLTPDQIKQLLVGSARAYPGQTDHAGTLNITAALAAAKKPPAPGLVMPLPVGASAPPAGANTVLWDGSRWSDTTWDGSRWSSAYWDSAHWGASEWDGSRWSSAYWDGSRWSAAEWDGSRWSNATWDSGASLD